MIDVKKAVSMALQVAQDLIPEDQLENLALEEVEFDEQSKEWLITIGYDTEKIIEKTSGPPFLFPTSTKEIERKYKIIRLNGETGEFKNMKIRKI